MTRWFNILSQSLLLVGQAVNVLSPYWTQETKDYVIVILTLVQGIVGVVAHSYNIDGTSQKAAYQPPPKP